MRRYLFLAIFFALAFGAGTALFFYQHVNKEDRVFAVTRTGTWVVAKLVTERYEFLSALDVYAQAPTEEKLEDLEIQFDVFWSRVPLLVAGKEAARLVAIPEVVQLHQEMLAELPALDGALRGLALDPVRSAEQIHRSLDPFEERLSLILQGLIQPGSSTQRLPQVESLRSLFLYRIAGLTALAIVLTLFTYWYWHLRPRANLSRAQRDPQFVHTHGPLYEIWDDLNLGMALFNRDSILVAANRSFGKIYPLIHDRIVSGMHHDEYKDISAAFHARANFPSDPIEATEGYPTEEYLWGDGRTVRAADFLLADGAVLCFRQDLTDRRRTEQALMEVRNSWQRFADELPLAVFCFTLDGRLTWANQQAAGWVDRPLSELETVRFDDLFSKAVSNLTSLQDGSAPEQAVQFDETMTWPDGITRRTLGRLSYTADADSTAKVGAMLFLEDENEYPRPLGSSEDPQELGVLVEISNCFTHQVLQLSKDVEEESASIGASSQAAFGDLLRLANQVLDYNEVARDIQVEPVHLALCLNELSDRVRKSFERPTDFSVTSAEDLWKTKIDVSSFLTILMKLVDDTGRFENKAGLAISAENYRALGGEVDRAIGLAPGDYVQVKLVGSGDGPPFENLGLSLAHAFALRSGGALELGGQTAQPRSVSLYLPRHVDQEPKQEAGPLTVAVVIAESAVQEFILSQLQMEGYSASGFADCEALLDFIADGGTCDLVMAELVLKGAITWQDLTEKAQALRPGLPIMYLASTAQIDIPEEIGRTPGTALMRLPFTRADLRRKILMVMG